MERDREHFRHLILYCFDSKKTAGEAYRFIAETYSEFAPSVKTCEYWYRRFKSGDFNLKDKERSGQPKKFEDAELQALLDENPAQTLEELAEALNVGKSTVSDRLHAMGKIQKESKWVNPSKLTGTPNTLVIRNEANMAHKNEFFRYVVLHYFYLKKNAAETYQSLLYIYGKAAPSERICKKWMQRFKESDTAICDRKHPGQSRNFDNKELQELLDENPTQTFKELSVAFGVDKLRPVSRRLHALEEVHKEEEWVPHQLSESSRLNRLNICTSLLAKHRKKSFLWRIVTGDEKWIYYENSKRRKLLVEPSPDEPSTSTSKLNIHADKVMLCIWWDMEGVVQHEFLNPDETVNATLYQRQLERLNDELIQKRPSIARNRRKVILQYDNTRPHVAKAVKETLMDLEWESLPHPAYSPDLAPSNFHLFHSMQFALEDTYFSNLDELRKWVDDWIASKHISFFRQGIQLLPKRWQKVVESDGNYFD